MKIAVLGTGAMGSVYAGLLGAAGHEVWAVDIWAEHIAAIQAKGLRVEGASGERCVPIQATVDPAEAGNCDLVIVATKAAQVATAAASAAPLIGPETLVLTIQNGVGAAERIRAALPSADIVNGIAGGFGASVLEPGQVHHNGMALIGLAEIDGPATARLRGIAELWSGAGFTVRVFDDNRRMVWEKLICNVAFSGPCAVSQRTIGQVLASEELWAVAAACAREAYEIARAQDIALSFDDPAAQVRAFGGKMPGTRPSMLLDRLAGRHSEIGFINGAMPELGARLGVPTPTNAVIGALIRAYEEDFA